MKIVIIGGVAAGMSAAAKAKRISKDAQVVVYEKTDVISWGACGLPYYVGDFFGDAKNMIARSIEKFKESGIEVNIKHQVIKVNTKTKTIVVRNLKTGGEFEDSYDRLMIATGASSIIQPIKNIDLKNIFMLKEFRDGVDLKEEVIKEQIKDVVIIGAGFVGLETAEAMKNLGKNVCIIEVGSRVLADAFDKDITDIMEAELINQQVSLHLNEMVKEFKCEGIITEVVTDKEVYKADLVIICTGVRPNTDFLKDTGIEMLKNGAIIINEYGETSIKDIYAAGDCATVRHIVKGEDVYIPLATTANKIGRIVGENLIEKKRQFQGTLGSAAVKVMKLEAARTGITENDAIKKGLNYKTVFIKDKNQTSYYPGQSDIYIKLIYDSYTKVLLGGQIIGEKGAVLRVDVLASAIFSKMTTEQLGMLDLCYAPPFSTTWDVVNVAANVAK